MAAGGRTLLLVIAMLAIGGIGGYVIGTGAADAPPAPLTPAIEAPTTSVEPEAEPVPTPALEVGPAPAGDAAEALTVLSLLELPTDFEQTAALYRLLEASDGVALRRHIEDAKLIPTAGDRRAAMSIIFLRLSELEPDNVIAVLDHQRVEERGTVFFTIFNSWAKVDLDATLARLDSVPIGGDRQSAANGIYQAYTDDPEALAQISARLQGASAMAQWGNNASLAAKARLDPLGALEEALSLSRPQERMMALGQIAGVWAQQAPREALRNADLIPDPGLRRNFRRSVLMTVANQSPERALDLIDEAVGLDEQRQLLQMSLQRIAQSDARRALERAREMADPGLRRMALEAVFTGWANQDPAGAADALLTIDDEGLVRQIAQNMLYSYARMEPRAALAWVERLEDGRGELWEAAINAIAQSEPELALVAVAELPPSPRQAQLMQRVISGIATQDPGLAISLIDQLPAGMHRENALRQIASSWSRLEPDAALQWLAQQDARRQANLAGHMAHSIYDLDPELARRFTSRLDRVAQEQWIGTLLNQLLHRDPEAAAHWILDYADASAFGSWAGQVAARLVRIDPGAALDLIGAVDDVQQRRQATSRFLMGWADLDPGAAARWLEQSGRSAVGSDPSLFGVVADRWYNVDPDAATAWARSLDTRSHRDRALGSIASSDYLEPTAAAQLINEIVDDNLRSSTASNRVYQLGRFDPDAAQTFLDMVDIDDQQREHLRNAVADMGGGG
ncbi:MAG: hypothetical protein AAGE01_19175 [Pseudomonadota bacterium]